MEKEMKHALKATNLLIVHRCYVEILRKRYADGEPVSSYYTEVGNRIKQFIERCYGEIVSDYLKTCESGDSKSAKSKVRMVLNAIGANAFNEYWFTEGLKFLYRRNIRFQFPVFKKEHDYSRLFLQGCRVEKKLERKSALNTFAQYNKSAKKQSDYYRELPEKMSVVHLHMCYGLLNEELHAHMIEDYPAMDLRELDCLIRAVDNNFLPK